MAEFRTVAAARKAGWNVKQEPQGWVYGELTIDGWVWSEIGHRTRGAALKAAEIIHNNRRK